MQAHKLVIKCLAWEESQPLRTKKPELAELNRVWNELECSISNLASIFIAPRNQDQIGALELWYITSNYN